MKIQDILKENLDNKEVLYHVSPKDNRQSISYTGLNVDNDMTGMGAIFMSDTLPEHHPNFDMWIIDANGLDIEEDPDGFDIEDENWYLTYETIPPSKIRMYQQT